QMARLARPKKAEPRFVNAINEGPVASASLNDPVAVDDEAARQLVPREAGIRDAERLGARVAQRRELCGTSTDAVVLHQHGPPALAYERQPFLVADALPALLAVNRGERVNDQAGGTQFLGDAVTP